MSSPVDSRAPGALASSSSQADPRDVFFCFIEDVKCFVRAQTRGNLSHEDTIYTSDSNTEALEKVVRYASRKRLVPTNVLLDFFANLGELRNVIEDILFEYHIEGEPWASVLTGHAVDVDVSTQWEPEPEP